MTVESGLTKTARVDVFLVCVFMCVSVPRCEISREKGVETVHTGESVGELEGLHGCIARACRSTAARRPPRGVDGPHVGRPRAFGQGGLRGMVYAVLLDSRGETIEKKIVPQPSQDQLTTRSSRVVSG